MNLSVGGHGMWEDNSEQSGSCGFASRLVLSTISTKRSCNNEVTVRSHHSLAPSLLARSPLLCQALIQLSARGDVRILAKIALCMDHTRDFVRDAAMTMMLQAADQDRCGLCTFLPPCPRSLHHHAAYVAYSEPCTGAWMLGGRTVDMAIVSSAFFPFPSDALLCTRPRAREPGRRCSGPEPTLPVVR